ncbi:TetR/AcrR family transcriptional regulator [Mycobacterium sp. ACS4331]|uniref:TetR/AcrR family transcriptional regulator n=1 Tax=Mycobacterium sp. ACS4331 TaxID=1834121 RepID=UPI0007FD2D74|nr:TetR/AcrR family transcriptional regulator [Mycobacterium sp. ACS4331]OBF21552.1 TetR family transcriptional regulator [Mycobacterium sp. ACS4331]
MSRRYDNSRRRADAEARQRRIVEAATSLFLEHGFGATSIDQVATAAEVSAPTIYATFGNKAGLLARVIDIAVVGDYRDIPVVDRILAVIEGAGAGEVEQLVAVAQFIRTLNERVAPLIRVMEQAASTDPALQELRTRLIGGIRSDCAVAVAKAWRTALRPELPEDEAADVLATMVSPEVYSMLTADSGWSSERYEQWLAHALPALLLRPDLCGAAG